MSLSPCGVSWLGRYPGGPGTDEGRSPGLGPVPRGRVSGEAPHGDRAWAGGPSAGCWGLTQALEVLSISSP